MKQTLHVGQKRAPDRTPGRELSPLEEREQRMKAARARVGGHRNKLTVQGKSSEHHYRWVLDAASNGQKLMQLRRLGFELASVDDIDDVGESFIQASDGNTEGSVIRAPAGDGKRYMFLMRIPADIYNDNRAVTQEKVDAIEAGIFKEADKSSGMYGAVKREQNPRYPG